ncbi:heterokaryon incompatibility protein-domain-containing protein, partial [Epithele typhae]|uniref:heterokaryon incompatibility protein-domain-containing protein n=1 Tax=Epithele typhae TaxID=378194 RepID=UPI002008D62B
MWMLSTARAELHFFSDPSAVPGGYCILSHTWFGQEQSFQEIQDISRACAPDNTNPRDSVSEKIRKCCLKAEEYDLDWIWIDSCCIDKTSSTELSEAINSMFSWYVLAEVCFVFLEDVPVDDDFYAEDSAFRRARWHRRGWTLQELLAPAFMIFFSKEWERIGTKQDLARLLDEVTGVALPFLVRDLSFLDDASVSERMHWASRRNTTRVEDEAYCLLGIFDIKMTTLYGEGQQAFRRLQQEIVKRSPSETSILSWG